MYSTFHRSCPPKCRRTGCNYIGTRDVDGTAAAAVRAGGSILKGPEDIKGAGRYAILKDPQGAAFAILDPENARPEAAGPPPGGSFAWHELATSDNEAAFAFYSGLFGWDAMERMDMGPVGIYLIFGSNGVQRGGMYIKPPDMPAPPNWLPYVSHANADKAMETAVATGGKSMNGPMDVPGGAESRCSWIRPAPLSPCLRRPRPRPHRPSQSRRPKPRRLPSPRPKPKRSQAKAQAEGEGEGEGQVQGEIKGARKEKEGGPETRGEEKGHEEEVEAGAEKEMKGRREVIKAGIATLAGAQLAWAADKKKDKDEPRPPPAAPLMTKTVPSTGERLAVLGVGTNNYSPTTARRTQRAP